MRSGIALGMTALFVALAGCESQDEKEVLPPVVLGMPENTAPTFDDGQTQIFQVSREVRLPYRRAEEGERTRGELFPYPRYPFHHTSQTRVTVRYALTNLDDAAHNVEILIDPWNEFVRYVPGVTMVREDEAVPNFSGIQRMTVLPPKARLEGIITPDDMVELARDLTVAMALERTPPDAEGDFGGASLYNRTFNIQNRSSEPDPVLRQWMPPNGPDVVIAAVTGFDLGLRTYEPSKIAIELVIDIEDLDGEKVVLAGDPEGRKLNRPGETLTPPAAAE